MADLPTGTVTFLFTDIEDGGAAFWPRSGQRRGPGPGTRLWEQDPEAMRAALARHDGLLREAVDAAEGRVFKKACGSAVGTTISRSPRKPTGTS